MVHLPVMVKELVELLSPKRGEVWVDATVGAGGHSLEVLKLIGEDGFLIGIDRDADALEVARRRLEGLKNVRLVQANFSEIDEVVRKVGVQEVDGVIFDLGVSSLQIDSADRGFSFYLDGPLDMRMDRGSGLTAYDVVNSMSEEELKRIIAEYGEERYAALIARRIVLYRRRKEIRTTAELVDVIRSALPMRIQRKMGKHPARRVFQALRIYVNDEMGCLDRGIAGAVGLLSVGGRMGVITFHSLEDRLVKRKFREFAAQGVVELLNRRVVKPSDEEVRSNRRARSAKLRGVKKVGGIREHQR